MVVREVESIGSEELRSMLTAIREAYGYDFTQYAEASMKRRSLFFMNSHNIRNTAELLELLLKDESVFEEFIRNISVTVTEMFRDPHFYTSLRIKVMKRLATYPFIKVWVAGCASGEEVYSIAILLKEAGLLSRSLIYATDINQHSLQQAKEGIFPLELMKSYSTNYIDSGGQRDFSSYYVAEYGAALMNKSLRSNIVFAPHNLATDQSFNEFQLILCRNVLIYFNHELQNRVINLMHASLCDFGILGLGNKETLSFTDKKQCFETLDKKEKIYIKNP
jgi:chemotaxis protein methyltransferase CheR